MYIYKYIYIYIYINDLFFIMESANMYNYVGDTAFHACDANPESLVKKLEHELMLASHWVVWK